MTQTAKAQEPSMEEILASIRRIIADDDATKTTPRAPEPQAEAPPAPPVHAPPPMAPPRAVFAEEPHPVAPPPEPYSGDVLADPSSDILDLTESMAAPTPPPPAPEPMPAPMPQAPPQFRTIDGNSDLGFDDVSERPAPPRSRVPDHGYAGGGQLLSSQTSAAVDSAFSALAESVLVKNGVTLEDIVRDMLRPMLKNWLDDNLPGMVERLVRAEIERVSRGRAG